MGPYSPNLGPFRVKYGPCDSIINQKKILKIADMQLTFISTGNYLQSYFEIKYCYFYSVEHFMVFYVWFERTVLANQKLMTFGAKCLKSVVMVTNLLRFLKYI